MHLLYPPQSSKDTGLGNTLYQLATMYALSKEYGFEINIYELELYCNLLEKFNFDHKNKIFYNFFKNYKNYLLNNNNIIKEGEIFHVEQFLDNNFINRIKKNLNNNIIIEGYFQSHLYFDKYKLDIYKLFKIDDNSLNYIKNKYPILFDNNITSICIHIRMNYANSINYNFNYFEKAIKYFKERFNNIHFFIFSNKINLIENWFQDKCSCTYVTNNIDYIDLWIMSLCKHNIITHSTFSWWGAYLNSNPEKIVLFPSDSLRISMGNLYPNKIYEQRRNEFYMPEWIEIEDETLYFYN